MEGGIGGGKNGQRDKDEHMEGWIEKLMERRVERGGGSQTGTDGKRDPGKACGER